MFRFGKAAKGKVHRLTEITLGEVSLVDDPANQHAHVVLWKRADAMPAEIVRLGRILKDAGVDFDSVMAAQELRETLYESMDDIWDAFFALSEANSLVLQDENVADKGAALQTNMDQFRAKLEELIPTIVPKRHVPPAPPAPHPGNPKESGMFKTLEEALAHIQKMTGEHAAQITTLTTTLKTTQEALSAATKQLTDKGRTTEDVIKGLPPEARAIVEAALAATATVEKLKDDVLTATYVKRAESFKNLTVDAPTFALTLKRIATGKSEEKDAQEIERLLKAADEAVAQSGILKQLGQAGSPEAQTAMQQVEAAAAALMTKDPSLSKSLAITKALDANPALYDRYRAELPGHRQAA